MTVVESVELDLARLPVELRASGEAALALAMARVLDGEAKGSASECGKVLMEALRTLRDLAPPEQKRDGLDAIQGRRGLRLVGGSGAKA